MKNGTGALAQKLSRRSLAYCIFQPRDADANPYYPRNEILGRCIGALEEIVSQTGPKTIDPAEASALADAALTKQGQYTLCHDEVVLTRLAGGHRSKIANDTELKFLIYLMPETAETSMDNLVKNICRSYQVSVRRTDAIQGGKADA